MTIDPLAGMMLVAAGALNLGFGIVGWVRPGLLLRLSSFDPITRWVTRNQTDQQRRRGTRRIAVLSGTTGVLYAVLGMWSVLSG